MADIHAPSPDRGHELLRQELLAAIATGQQNTAGVDDSYFLTDVLFDLASSLLTQVGDALAQIDALQQRVAQLENPPLAP